MTIETVSQWSVVLLLLLVAILSYFILRPGKATSPRDRVVDPDYASRYYAAYIGETARLAGLNPAKFLEGVDLSDAKRVLKLAITAEEMLLLMIVTNLVAAEDQAREDAESKIFQTFSRPEKSSTDPGRLDEFSQKYRQGGFEEARRRAGDERTFEFALTILKKINPIIQQIAGSWVEGKAGLSK